MLNRHDSRGFTLVETMVALIVMSCLLLVGTPSFTRWIQEMQVRTAAESVQTGLQLARGEAVRRNQPVQFLLRDVGGLVEWQVGCKTADDSCPAQIMSTKSSEFGRNARAGATKVTADAAKYDVSLSPGSGLPFAVEFNGLGAIVGGSVGRIDISNAGLQPSPRLCVLVGANGLIRLCNPALSRASDPAGCS
jgi:type IV fimbrial biogenesis protein FimT